MLVLRRLARQTWSSFTLVLRRSAERQRIKIAVFHGVLICREYKGGHCRALEQADSGLEYRPFGFLAVISFPFNWAASFGEFGTQDWHFWGRKFQDAGIPVRSCVAHFIDMTEGA